METLNRNGLQEIDAKLISHFAFEPVEQSGRTKMYFNYKLSH